MDCFREAEVQLGSFLIFRCRIVSFTKITFHGISLVYFSSVEDAVTVAVCILVILRLRSPGKPSLDL